jgi:hypothetical protein
MEDLNVRPETSKLLEENIAGKYFWIQVKQGLSE